MCGDLCVVTCVVVTCVVVTNVMDDIHYSDLCGVVIIC